MSRETPETNPQNNLPFKLGKRVETTGKHSELYEVEGNEDVLVKKLYITDMSDMGFYKTRKSNYSLEDFRKHYQEAIDLLKQHLGNHLPEKQLVFGSDHSGDQAGYLITEKVISDDVPVEKKLEMLDSFLKNVVEMYAIQKSDRRLVPEVWNEENIRFGHTSKNPESKYYLLDVYPLFKTNREDLDNKLSSFFQKYQEFDFIKTREALEKV